jgi:hypothetical protein
MRYRSKRDLLAAIEREHRTLVDLLATVPPARYREAGVWGDGWTVNDLLAHLTEWEQMFLRWYREGRRGGTPAMPAPGYRWNETPRLNRDLQRIHRAASVRRVRERFDRSYRQILALARRLSPADLLVPGRMTWTGKLPLSAYLGPNSASHYRFATRVLRRWLRG